jgi:hypothetical protein
MQAILTPTREAFPWLCWISYFQQYWLFPPGNWTSLPSSEKQAGSACAAMALSWLGGRNGDFPEFP